MTWKRPNRMHAIGESEANKCVADVYKDIKTSLSLPQVPLFFQMCAAREPFLPQFWEAVKPVVRTRSFLAAAQRLRADAYTRMHNYFEIPSASESFGLAAPAELAATLELFHYQNGAMLLLLSLAAIAFDNPVGQSFISREEGSPPTFSVAPMLVEQDAADPETRKVFEEARRYYGLDMLPIEFRALAAWPAFMNQHWKLWRHVIESPMLAACEHQLLLHSIELANDLPGPIELSSATLRQQGMNEEEFSGIIRFTHNWNRASAMLLLQISAAQISAEGGSAYKQTEEDLKQDQAA